MTGPVRKSPSETEILMEQTTTLKKVSQPDVGASMPQRPLKLIEKFALQMGGVEPDKMVTILKQTAFRLPDKYRGGSWQPQEVTNEQMGALLVVAHAYGLNPFLKEIYAFPDKGGIVPIVGVDGWSRMINNHEQFDGLKFEFSDEKVQMDDHCKPSPDACTCIIFRKDRSHPTEVTEYLDEVYRPAFEKKGEVKSGPWQTHTKRMLRHKATIQAARLAFGFTGIHDQDEAERIVTAEYIPASDEPTQSKTLTDRFKTDDVIEGETVEAKSPLAGLANLDVINAEAVVEPEPETEDTGVKSDPEPKPKPTAEKKRPLKKPKPPPVPTVEANYLNQLLAADSVDRINDILTATAEDKGLSQAKKMVIKKAAKAKVAELSD